MFRQLNVPVGIALASTLCIESAAAVGAQHRPRQPRWFMRPILCRGVKIMVCAQRSLGVVLLAILFGCGAAATRP